MNISVPSFSVPRDGSVFVRKIFRRCHDLIAYGIWTGIEPSRLDLWIANFQTEEERYFAACILDSLIYRSTQQTVSLMKQLFQCVLPDYGRLIPDAPRCLDGVYEQLKNHAQTDDPGIRLVPVILGEDPYSKSAPAVARMLRRQMGFNEGLIIRAEQVPASLAAGAELVIFVDDFLGTGEQFETFLRAERVDVYAGSGRLLYAPLVAHVEGRGHLRRTFPGLHVEPVELLDDRHAVFHDHSRCLDDDHSCCFDDGANSPDGARDFYYDLLDRHGITIAGSDRRGYGHFELVYAFEHAVPDNSLPILWWPHTDGWLPLFAR